MFTKNANVVGNMNYGLFRIGKVCVLWVGYLGLAAQLNAYSERSFGTVQAGFRPSSNAYSAGSSDLAPCALKLDTGGNLIVRALDKAIVKGTSVWGVLVYLAA